MSEKQNQPGFTKRKIRSWDEVHAAVEDIHSRDRNDPRGSIEKPLPLGPFLAVQPKRSDANV